MAASDSRLIPLVGGGLRVGFCFADVTTDKVLSGAWTGAQASISIDGANFANTTNAAVQIQSTGFGYVDLTSSEAPQNDRGIVFLKVVVTNANANDIKVIIPYELYNLPATDPNNFAVLVQDGALYGQIDTDSGGVPLSPDGLRLLNPTDPLTLDDAQDLIMMSARYFTHGVAINRDTSQELLFGDDGVTPRFMADVSFNGTTETKGAFEVYSP